MHTTPNDQFHGNIPNGIHNSSWCRNDNYYVYDYDVLYDGGREVIDTDIEQQMSLRQQVLQILFKKFGKGEYSNKKIYECADEWVEKYVRADGVVAYYKAYFDK